MLWKSKASNRQVYQDERWSLESRGDPINIPPMDGRAKMLDPNRYNAWGDFFDVMDLRSLCVSSPTEYMLRTSGVLFINLRHVL